MRVDETEFHFKHGFRLKLGDTHPHTLQSWHNLIDLYKAWGKPEKAKEWRSRLLQNADTERQD